MSCTDCDASTAETAAGDASVRAALVAAVVVEVTLSQ